MARSHGRLVAAVAAALLIVSCAGKAPAPISPVAGPPVLDGGWQLTLPVPGPKGGAQIVKPAAVSPPWLTADPAGALVFWAPVRGVTTKNSEHARTELDRLDTFAAGRGARTLSASLAVTQLPAEVPEVIVGQVHGAADISSVPFVMLFYANGALRAVVKQEQSGNAHTDIPLLTDVGLGVRFDYTITDGGDGTVGVTATANGRTAAGSAPVPAAFSGATVRFQAGAYQQAPSSETAADTDGARVTFTAITVGPAVHP